MKTLLTILGLTVLMVAPLWANHAILTSDGPFYTSCESGVFLSADTPVYILRDANGNGPDSLDVRTCTPYDEPYGCYPEAAYANFYMFYLNAEGGFTSPLYTFYPDINNPHNSLYLAIYFGEAEDSCYTSPSFTIAYADSNRIISFPRSDWVCGSRQIPKLPCESPVPYFEIILGSSPTEYCLETCNGGLTEVPVKYAGQDLHRPPVFAFAPGCDSACNAIDSVRLDLTTWWLWESNRWWWSNFNAYGRGCVTMTWLDEPPVVHLDTFQLLGQGDQITVSWYTSYENGTAAYRLWRGAHSTNWREPVATISAMNSAGGANYGYTDPIPAGTSGLDYNYLLEVIATTGDQYPLYFLSMDSSHWLGIETFNASLPVRAALLPAYPNPFNATTRIAYDLDRAGVVKLEILNLLGQWVTTLIDAPQTAGRHEALFDGHDLASGVYICRLQTGEGFAQQKLLLLK